MLLSLNSGFSSALDGNATIDRAKATVPVIISQTFRPMATHARRWRAMGICISDRERGRSSQGRHLPVAPISRTRDRSTARARPIALSRVLNYDPRTTDPTFGAANARSVN